MGLPHVFEPGEVAAASEVNENFRYLADILGEDSTAELVHLRGLKVGNGAFVAPSPAANSLTWNMTIGNNDVIQRRETNKPASRLDIGTWGLDFSTTSATAGDLNSQVKTVFAVRPTVNEDWVYIDPNWSIQRVNARPKSIEDYRLTYVPLNDPVT